MAVQYVLLLLGAIAESSSSSAVLIKPDITNNFIINKLVNGDKRLAAGPDIRRPITVTILGRLLHALAHVIKAYYQRIMFEAVSL
jgi:hypothetical protein